MIDRLTSTLEGVYGHHVTIINAKELFSRLENQMPYEYCAYRLTTKHVAKLLRVSEWTVLQLVKRGKLKSKKEVEYFGNLRTIRRKYSLRHIADYLESTKRMRYNGVENKTWTQQEVALLKKGYIPEGRSRQGCIHKKIRLKKEGTWNE